MAWFDVSADRSLLIRNATIHLCDANNSRADAILIEGRRVAAAGAEHVLRQRARTTVKIWDVRGATVLPGLIDTHPHLLHFGSLEEPLVDITAAVSQEDIIRRIADRARNTAPGQWIMTTPVGEPHYFIRRSYRDLEEGELPTRQILDRASDKHSVMIQAWAPVIPNTIAFNSLALETLGLTRDLPDRVGGISIEKDQNGELTGRLHGAVNNYYAGDEFGNQIWRKIPMATRSPIAGVKRAIAGYHRLGVTAIYENHLMNARQIDAYRRLRAAGELQMRVMTAQESDSFGTPWRRARESGEFMDGLQAAADSIELTDDYFRFNGLSVQWDGGCYPGDMMMREAYFGPDGKETRGRYMMDPGRIEIVMRFCAQKRIRLHTLVSGTQAHEDNLALLEGLAPAYDIRPLRWILVHTPFIEPEQIERYRRLNFDVTTTMTFLFGTGDLYRRRFKQDHVTEALKHLLPLRRFFDAGFCVGGGTDWGPRNVFEQIQLSLLHRTPSGYLNLGADQKISREEAISMWTHGAARLLQWWGIGSLPPGGHADLVIIDRDPVACPVEDIGGTQVLHTMFDGSSVYDAGTL